MAEAPATPTATPLLFGRYRVQESLGESRLAAVYAATDERLHRRVLLHLLRKELVSQEHSRERFVAEIGQSARRSHQALLEIFDSGEVSGRPFMVSEYVGGRPLRGIGLLTAEQALLYMRQVAGAIAACQAQRSPELPAGLFHPPITSTNVLLVDEGRVKLVESWQLPLADAPRELAHYRAPELSEGKPATPASAVYALGLLCYELLTGVRPVSGEDARAVALAHLSARIPPLTQARPALYLPSAEQLIAKATARYPDQRYADAQAFGAALDALWRDLGASTQRLAAAGAARRRPHAAAAAAPAPAPTSAPRVPAPPAPAPEAPPSSFNAPPPPIQARPAVQPAPAPRPPTPQAQRSSTGLSGITGRIARGLRGQATVEPDQVRQGTLVRNIIGWLVLVGLVALVGLGTYAAVNALIDGIGGLPTANLPRPPSLPTAQPNSGGPFDWLANLFGGSEEIYYVNIADGLNMRSAPDTDDPANIIAVIPNGTPVRKLEGPVEADGIPWLRVSAEVNGTTLEGWMSGNYLKLEP